MFSQMHLKLILGHIFVFLIFGHSDKLQIKRL